ncbi:SirB1 family protein [Fontivita pretiosa]|uniref:SirB1 family protein n=1 Tax=Fontivita pretiosa TaxID=2989684 RepID=UPI003D174F36
MTPALPLCCNPEAFRLLARQVPTIDSPDALLQGAVAIAMHQMPNVDPAKVDATLQGYADAIRRRVRGSQPQALLAHLHAYLFDELGFVGNTENYYNTANSYLPAVLKSKRGLPITLSLIYKIVGERLGLRVHGLGLPGHFMALVELSPRESMIVDCFAGGRIVTPEQAQAAVQERFGPELEWSDEFFAPVCNLHWLTRMLQNLLHIFGGNGHYSDVAAMLEMEMLLWPQQTHLQRDLALVLARIGLSQPASMWLDKYLRDNPDDPQKSDLLQLLEVLTT